MRHVIIIVGFQKLISPAKLSARYQQMGLEAPSDIQPQSIIKTRSQYDNQIAIPRQTRGKGKGNFSVLSS